MVFVALCIEYLALMFLFAYLTPRLTNDPQVGIPISIGLSIVFWGLAIALLLFY